MPGSDQRVVVLYNNDYDEELIAAVDVSAVRQSAQAITRAVAEYGLRSRLVGIHGRDLDEVVVALRDDPPDLVFNLCESLCNDARNEIVVPAVLDMLGIPYTGTAALELGLCLHKDRAKGVLASRGVATPPHCVVQSRAHMVTLRDRGDLDDLDYPFFLKLAHEDASIGIEASNRVDDADALMARAGQLLDRYRQPVIAERFIAGREVNVTVMGNRPDPGATAGAPGEPENGPLQGLEILPLHEIDFAAMPEGSPHIVSYAAKWDEDHPDYAGTLPVPLRDASPEVVAAIRTVAAEAFVALGLRDFGRVDLRIDDAGQPWVIDVNPNCDLSPDAGVARAAAVAGMSYPQLVGRICELAWQRVRDAPAGDGDAGGESSDG